MKDTTVYLTPHASQRLNERFSINAKNYVKMPRTAMSEQYINYKTGSVMQNHFIKLGKKYAMFVVSLDADGVYKKHNTVVTVYESGHYYDQQIAKVKRLEQRLAA